MDTLSYCQLYVYVLRPSPYVLRLAVCPLYVLAIYLLLVDPRILHPGYGI